METGWDILFFWVARMILSTTYITGEIPFNTVYLHGMIRAADGKKMSKSRPESIIDPLTVIPEYGTDALRMALITGVSPGNDQNWGWGKVEANRNFCNKLWNIARYVEDKLDSEQYTVSNRKAEAQSAADHWILQKLQHSSESIDKDIRNYAFGEACDTLYHFVWDDFADWYIEASKTELNLDLLAYTLEAILKIAHPFAPFVTETIWQTLAWEQDNLLATSEWPTISRADDKQAAAFETIKTVVSEARYLAKALGVIKPQLCYTGEAQLLEENAALIARLGKLSAVTQTEPTERGIHLTETVYNCWLDIDVETGKKYLEELASKREAQTKTLQQLKGRLANKSYVANAPEQIVAQTKQQLEDTEKLLENIGTEYERFKSILDK
jgi:valyl-tRNA synthetase